MKFLLMIKARKDAVVTPDILRIHKKFVREALESGKADVGYTFAGTSNGMAIINADDFEELGDFMLQTPMAALTDIDIYPLADFQKQMDRVIKVLEAQR